MIMPSSTKIIKPILFQLNRAFLFLNRKIKFVQQFGIEKALRQIHYHQKTFGTAFVVRKIFKRLSARDEFIGSGIVYRAHAKALFKISVVIPCYNQYHYLEESISSAFRSYSGEVEVIVVDDGSDGEQKSIWQKHFKEKYSDIIIINNDFNVGVAASRNIGIAIASGEYIQLLDADDILVANKNDILLDSCVLDDKTVYISDYIEADENLLNRRYLDSIERYCFSLREFLLYWERGMSIPIHCALFPKSIKNIRFCEGLRTEEDFVFWVALVVAGYKISYFKFIGAVYRIHSANNTRNISGERWLPAVIEIKNNIINNCPVKLIELFVRKAMKHYVDYYLPLELRSSGDSN